MAFCFCVNSLPSNTLNKLVYILFLCIPIMVISLCVSVQNKVLQLNKEIEDQQTKLDRVTKQVSQHLNTVTISVQITTTTASIQLQQEYT